MDDHYRRNHLGKPHEHLVSGLNPQKQHKWAEVNYSAYYILLGVLGFGLIVLALLALAMCLENRKRKREEDMEKRNLQFDEQNMKRSHESKTRHSEKQSYHATKQSNRNLYPNPDIEEEKGSLFDGSMVTTTTTEIQPKAPPLSCEQIGEMARNRGSFGLVNIHKQQSGASSTADFSMHNSASSQQLPPQSSSSSATNASSTVSLAGNGKRMSKMESFPYEEYGIPENERQPIKTRVQDLKTYDNFLHITCVDSEMLGEESVSDENSSSGNEDDGRVGKFESRATLPRHSFDRQAN